MAKGLPRSIVKKYGVTKKAWQVYRGTKNRKVNKSRSTKIKRVKKMARRSYRKKRRKRRTRTIPLAPTIGFFGPLLSAKYGGRGIIEHVMNGNFKDAAKDACVLTTGYDPVSQRFDITQASALHGLLIGIGVHKAVQMLGGNRIFSNLPSPLNKLRI